MLKIKSEVTNMKEIEINEEEKMAVRKRYSILISLKEKMEL